ncbi:MAG: hypothetical protein ACJ8G2_02670 [Burkholderiales bacterium]
MNQAKRILLSEMLAFLWLMHLAQPVRAWIYPEHRDIAVLAVQALDPARKAIFDRLWDEARTGSEQRLCAAGADVAQGLSPSCIDWAAFSGIAGDHSCSSSDMLEGVLKSNWILKVAGVAAQLKSDLAKIEVAVPPEQAPTSSNLIVDFQRRLEAEAVRAQRINALRTSDSQLQGADVEYATRAGANNAHFLLARPRTDVSAAEYAGITLNVGAEISAVGVYSWYHVSALQKATRLAKEQLAPEQRQAIERAMLADEAFALHFLEDIFAAGHVAGSWGDASQRKGTHDYYNEAGLEVFVWKGSSESTVLMGDAHMRPQDAERAAVAVRGSLEQLLDHAAGHARTINLGYTPGAPAAPDAFNVCKNNSLVRREEGQRVTPEALELAYEVLRPTPVPGLGPGLGSMPRFRAELGKFIGMAGSVDMRNISGGFVESQDEHGWMGGVDLSVRAGMALDGVMGESGDGLVFASLGVRGDGASSNNYADTTLADQSGSLGAAIPTRVGLSTRIRMPFYLIPGDLLFLSPIYLFAPERYTNMAVTAGNGGLIPWQLGWSTRFGRFQFVLGRELGVTFYGLGTTDTLLAPSATPTSAPRLASFKSTSFDLPIIEYRPFRAFDTKQSSSVLVQLFAAADVPRGGEVVSPAGEPAVSLKTVYSVGLRLIFDWRYYF